MLKHGSVIQHAIKWVYLKKKEQSKNNNGLKIMTF